MSIGKIISPFFGSYEVEQNDDFGVTKLMPEKKFSLEHTMTLKMGKRGSRKSRKNVSHAGNKNSLFDLIFEEK